MSVCVSGVFDEIALPHRVDILTEKGRGKGCGCSGKSPAKNLMYQ